MSTRTPLSHPVRVIPPQPDIPETLRTAVIDALRWAWSRLREETTVDPMNAGEEEITNEIEDLLNQQPKGRRRAHMLRLFGKVVRSGQQRSAGASFRQSPDLTFQPKSTPREVTHIGEWGLFAECKIVEPTSDHSPGVYCRDGVARFVDGRYAKSMSSGLMVAYVRDGRHPFATLKSLLGNAIVRAHPTDIDLLYTIHDRSMVDPPCVTIELAHVWLDARLQPAAGETVPSTTAKTLDRPAGAG
ncbi:MAG: hypothetical protein IPM54_33160 [Polyangiaceae bacterium]|nr:hypothetical protein [Polyangiaceae bacterium]